MDSSKKGLLLHVGLPKTGSKTLQQALFTNHSQLFYLGKYVEDDSPVEVGSVTKGCLSREVYEILRPVLWEVNRPFDITAISKRYHEQILPQVPNNQYMLGSWEALGDRPSENYLQMLARVKEIFGSCRIMYVLRNPLTQVPSEYLQNIIGKFVKQGRKWMEPSASLDINTWFENRTSRTSRPDEALNYNRNIQDSVELLGRDNVGVFLFEELMETPESYYRALSNFIGIDADETVALCQQKHFHPRISQGQLDLIRKINSSYVSRTLLPYFPTKLRLELLKKASGASSPAKIPLTPELHEKISTATKEGHRWLVENLNLPLAQYNYSL